jgi:hypothetical protein
MPTFSTGKAAFFEIDDTGGTPQDISNVLNSIDFPQTQETAETTAFGASARSYIVSLTTSTVSVSGMVDATVDGYLKGGTEPATRTFTFKPGVTSGDAIYSGECIMTGYGQSTPVGDVKTFSADFQVTGIVTRTTTP